MTRAACMQHSAQSNFSLLHELHLLKLTFNKCSAPEINFENRERLTGTRNRTPPSVSAMLGSRYPARPCCAQECIEF
jgi:hypothetical protein